MIDVIEENKILLEVVNYYEENIKPYKYTYECNNNLKITFYIDESDICHLITGTIPKGTPNASKYRGIEGYNKIKSGEITITNLPHNIKKSKVKNRCNSFLNLENMLANPKAIYYNPKIVKKGDSIKLKDSDLKADFLLYKLKNNDIIHLFLRNEHKRVIPVSIFSQGKNKDEYITDQIEIKILNVIKTKI